jgi:GTP-binding protein EngB required for normal cell division
MLPMGASGAAQTKDQASTLAGDTARLERLASLAAEAGCDQTAANARRLVERIVEGRFYVACVGQFKRGKSTLLNALVGEAILPTGIVPVTSVVTVVRYGSERSARVRFTSGDSKDVGLDALSRYVAEAENPENAKGVAGVEVFLPSPLLASGLCLVDTPGLGSVFEGNTRATRAFVPEIDAALVVLGVDPPIGGEELGLVEEIARNVEHLIVVLNKADRHSAEERHESRSFAERILAERFGSPLGAILEVSAVEKLTGTGPARNWDALLQSLESLARDARGTLIDAAEARGFEALHAQLSHELDEEHGALYRPIEESRLRIANLKTCIADAERSISDLGHLFTAEQERLAKRLSERRERFLETAIPAAKAEFVDALTLLGDLHGRALRRKGFALAQEIYRRWVDRWKREEQPVGEQMYREAAQRFVDVANGLLGKLASSSDGMLSGLPRTLAPEVAFRVRSGVYYTEMMTLTSRSPLGWMMDSLRSRRSARKKLECEVGEYLERLLQANSARVRSDLEERALESRRGCEGEIRACLHGLYESAERGLRRAQQLAVEGKAAVQAELTRLEALRRRLAQLSSPERNA